MRTFWTALASQAVIFVAGVVSAANVVWMETERFRDPGGWVNDSQFIDQMGSPFLLAIGLDGPVKDAVTQVKIPAAGKYRLWARCHDWLPEYSPGRFQVGLAGRLLEHPFGQSKAKGWVWEDGGVYQLPQGPLEVRLHDLTGHYGRCDALVLTDDLEGRLPDDLGAIAALREQHGGVSRQIERRKPYDTVVVGGGLAGTFAAVAAARLGARVALIQDRPVLGGNSSTEVLVLPQGDTTREPLDPGEGGIVEEVRGDSEGYSQRLLDLVKREKNLDLYLNTHATGVEMISGDTIGAVEALHATTGQRMAISGTTFIDCTGDGSIGVWAGAEYRHGREPSSMYHETRAPEQADTHTMGGTLRYATKLEAGPVEFAAPAWARHFEKCSDFGPGRHPQLLYGGWQWVIEYGGMLDTYKDAEAIRDELLRIIWGMWDHAKNHCEKLSKQAAPYKLVWVSHVVGKRESRRLIGDYVMTEHDIDPAVLPPDRVSYGGWGIDIHPPGGFYDEGAPAVFSHKVKFSVPFRSLYSKNIRNLMMAGRCISVSHAALGATRVMITCGMQGQAVGTAAALCKQFATTPRGIYQQYITQLQQQLLKDGAYLIDLPNRDPRDLARTARRVSASSTAPANPLAEAGLGDLHALGMDRAVMFKANEDHIDSVAVYLESKNRAATPIKLVLRPAARLGDFRSNQDLAAATATVPPESRGWVEFKLAAKVQPGAYYYAMLPRTPGLSWALLASRPPETMRAYRSASGWKESQQCYAVKLDPPIAAQPAPPSGARTAAMFAPENVINGYARAVRGWPNSWRPDPQAPLPQWVELDFGGPVSLNTVHVSFQSKTMRAEAFRVETSDDGKAWRTVAEVSDNPDRRCVLRFDRTQAFKLRLLITKAQQGMGVCEIRAYDEP